MSYARLQHSGGAVPTTLAGDITSGDTSLNLAAATGWPDGTVGAFYIVIDGGTATEEHILATSRTSATLNSLTRGVDGTSASAHSAGAAIQHVFVAVEADEANTLVHATLGSVTTKGDLTPATATGTLGKLAAGANNTVIVADSTQTTGLKFSKIVAANITAGTITTTEIADGTIATADIANDAITTALIADANVTTAKIASGAVTAALLDPGSGAIIVCTSGTHPGSPTAGMTIYETDTGNTLVYQGATDTWTPPWNTAWGLMFQKVISTDVAHVQGTTIAGFTQSVTEIANRWLRIEATLRIKDSNASEAIEVQFERAASVLYRFDKSVGTDSPSTRTIDGAYTFASSAGTHSFTTVVNISVGSGDLTLVGTTGPCQWNIYDVGPNGTPS